jgi:hypothetical protein
MLESRLRYVEKQGKNFKQRSSAQDVESGQVGDSSTTHGLGRQTSEGNPAELRSRGVTGRSNTLLDPSQVLAKTPLKFLWIHSSDIFPLLSHNSKTA